MKFMTEERVGKISENLGLDEAAIFTSAPNRFYLTGFPSSAGAVLITHDNAYFLIDFRYFEKAKQTVNSCEVILCKNLYNQISEILKKHTVKTLLVETADLSVQEFKTYKEKLEGVIVSDDARIERLILEMRSIKSTDEQRLIKKAQNLTDDTFSYILERIAAGRTEKEVLLDMEFFMRKNGSEGVSFDFIVVSGKNSSLPHGVAGDKIIEKGDFVTMDFGAVVEGYRSDMTRTVAVGSADYEQREVYETVLKAQQTALSVIKPGVRCCDVDKAARDIITEAGYGECFGHALGHSVGIEIHENPAFSPKNETTVKPGLVMTVEPGIYIENRFGVRIEDMVFVTENGCTDITQSSRELYIL